MTQEPLCSVPKDVFCFAWQMSGQNASNEVGSAELGLAGTSATLSSRERNLNFVLPLQPDWLLYGWYIITQMFAACRGLEAMGLCQLVEIRSAIPFATRCNVHDFSHSQRFPGLPAWCTIGVMALAVRFCSASCSKYYSAQDLT
ncbi:hypothetical protein B0H11DRAFT_1899791 [Mycena galericulata]|nr:hypothetical protein B0H11DRAFT_1899791 [Mycena galericulata]